MFETSRCPWPYLPVTYSSVHNRGRTFHRTLPAHCLSRPVLFPQDVTPEAGEFSDSQCTRVLRGVQHAARIPKRWVQGVLDGLRRWPFCLFCGWKGGNPPAALWNEFLTRIRVARGRECASQTQGEKKQVAFPLWIYPKNKNRNPALLLSQGRPPCAGSGREDSSRETQLRVLDPGNPSPFSSTSPPRAPPTPLCFFFFKGLGQHRGRSIPVIR